MRPSRFLAPALIAALLSGCIIIPIPIVTTITPPARAITTPLPAHLAEWPASARCARPAKAAGFEAEILREINALRAEKGLSTLRPNARLRAAAQGQACDNAARSGISHIGSDGATLSHRVAREGYAARRAAENITLGHDGDPARVVAGWAASPGHRANLLDKDMTEMGLGYAPGARDAWTLVMARPR